MLGIKFTVETADADEPSPLRELAPGENLRRMTAPKGEPVAQRHPDAAVIAADTVVVLNGEYFGKPQDEQDAIWMLSTLSGETHEVYTGLMVLYNGGSDFAVQRTEVTFRELTDEEIAEYIATGEPMDKAGAYGIQGLGASLISEINGDYFNVMGLPVGLLRAMLFNIER